MTESSLDKLLLATFVQHRSAWDKVRNKFDDGAFETSNPYLVDILKLTDEFYARDKEAQKVDLPVLLSQIEMRKSSSPKHKEPTIQLAKEVSTLNVSADNIITLAIEMKRHQLGQKLGLAMVNNTDRERIASWLTEYNELLTATSLSDSADGSDEDEVYTNVQVEDIVATTMNKSALIKLAPSVLNEEIGGGILRGHHVVIFARPELGKTACAMTMLFGFAVQGLKVVYFGNEDPMKQVIQRAMSCFTGMTREEIKQHPARAQKLLDKRGWQNLHLIPVNPGTIKQLDDFCALLKPNVFVTDQLRNLTGKSDGLVQQLEESGKGVRQICQKHDCAGISFTQAGISAQGKLILDMGDVADSKTGLAASADLMIGMGMNDGYERMGLRMLSLCKNKINGSHTHFQVKIRPEISRLESP